MSYTKLTLLSIMILLFCKAEAQYHHKYTPLEASHQPDAITTSGGGNVINVDPYTGIGNVTIPIYNYVENGIDLGVNLTYSLKGIQVDQVASSVGLGWSLTTGSSISRITNGIEDEVKIVKNDTVDNIPLKKSHFLGGWNDYLHLSKHLLEKTYDIFNVSLGGRSFEFQYNRHNGDVVYTYPKNEISIRGITTQSNNLNFFDDSTTTSYLQSVDVFFDKDSIDIKSREISFYLIDEKGNQFLFIPGDVQRKEFNVAKSDSSKRWVANNWVISRVRTNTGKFIKFNYARTPVTYTRALQNEIFETFKKSGSIAPPDISWDFYPIYWSGYQSQLQSIEYPDGKVLTVHARNSTGARCDIEGAYVVDSITIEQQFDNNVSNSKTFSFEYNYSHTPTPFNSNTNATYNTPCNNIDINNELVTRLILNKILLKGNDHTKTEDYYSFTYHSSILPERINSAKDYYGYHNNKSIVPLNVNSTNYYFNVPYHVYNNNNGTTYSYGVDKFPDTATANNLQYIQAGILKEITNGLNKTTKIEYQTPHAHSSDSAYRQFSYYSLIHGGTNNNYTIDPEIQGRYAPDGLIVKSIETDDGVNSNGKTLTTYTFENGYRFFQGGYFWVADQIHGNDVMRRKYTNNMLTPHRAFRNSNHGYSDVTIITKNLVNNQQLSKVKYKFSNLMVPVNKTEIFDDSFDIAISYGHTNKIELGVSCIKSCTGINYHTTEPEVFQNFLMGLLLEKQTYDAANNLSNKVTNRYEINYFGPDSAMHSPSQENRLVTYDSVNLNYDTIQESRVTRQVSSNNAVTYVLPRVKQKTVTNYSGQQSKQTVIRYEYDVSDNITATQWADSKGDFYRKEYAYVDAYGLYDTCLTTSIQHRLTERLVKVDPYTSINNKVLSEKVISPEIHDIECVYPSNLAKGLYNNTNATWFTHRYLFYTNVNNIQHDLINYLPTVRFPYVYTSRAKAPVTIGTAETDENSALAGNTGITTLKRAKRYYYDDWTDGNGVFRTGNNVIWTSYDEDKSYAAFVFDSRIGKKIAEVNNATFNQIAYTGFEGFTQTSDNPFDYGRWNFDEAYVHTMATTNSPNITKPITGNYFYHLDSVNNIKLTTSLIAFTDYKLTFWADIPPKVYIGSTRVYPVELRTTTKGWALYSLDFNSGFETTLEIQDPNYLSVTGYIDEVRLHPKNATMKTYAYEPLFGINTICDERNNILYTEYDEMGRKELIRDIDDNILIQTDTEIQVTNN